MSDTIADPHADLVDQPAAHVGLELHNALVDKLTAAFDFAGTPGVSRYGVALTMAQAVHALRVCSLSPSAIRLSRHQCAELVCSLKTAQVAMAVVFAGRMDPEDQLLNVRGCGALILHWAASGRIRVAKPAQIPHRCRRNRRGLLPSDVR